METTGLLNGLLKCPEHGCPMIRIGDNYECVIERVDAHLGGKRVKDIVPDSIGTPLAFVFEDGHTLPLLCADCGRSLHVAPGNEDRVLKESSGLYLVGLAYVEPGEELEGLALVFARDCNVDLEDPKAPTDEILLHLDSARKLTCPDEKWTRPRLNRRTRRGKSNKHKRH